MRSRYKIYEPEAAYFVTSTIVEWVPIFNSAAYFDILISSLRFSQQKKDMKIYAFVVLDNHFHAVVRHPQLSKVMQSIKSYTAGELVDQLKHDKKSWALNIFQNYKLDHKKESRYQIWQEGFHPQMITDDDILTQKIDYIHWNPVKRGLVEQPEFWRYSSASSFFDGKCVLDLDSLEDLV